MDDEDVKIPCVWTVQQQNYLILELEEQQFKMGLCMNKHILWILSNLLGDIEETKTERNKIILKIKMIQIK